MQVIIRSDEETACDLAASIIDGRVRGHLDSVLGLATGCTMETLYDNLARRHERDGLDFSLIRTYNLDEYIGIPPDHPGSYRHYMNEHLFNKVNIDLRNTHLPLGMAEDLAKECEMYEKSINVNGGIDLQLLGIGESGHIGFNEPLSALKSRTRDKALTPTTIEQNKHLFDPPESMPKRAITMGVGTILEAKRILLLVTGSKKAEILAKAVEGPVTSMVSASALQLHERCTVIVDEAAAANLSCKEYYNWIFETEPEWEEYR
ncbi:MAG: glucosamine-6-phosphate deaminase [Kiritimatiellaeota bacterium]|nr:glucosamine-6-phosphate deaminase [Kiritimatiellota bacterium]